MKTSFPIEEASNVSFLRLLGEELQQRTYVNPRYSLRSFARHLKVDPSHLARVLKGKRQVSSRYVEWAGRTLNWSPETIRQAKAAVDVSDAKSGRKLKLATDKRFNPISGDEMQIASRWIHFVLLELGELSHFTLTVKSAAERLGVSLSVISEAVERLKRVGAMVDTPSGLRTVRQFTTTKTPGTTPALKRLQKEILGAAARALDDVAPELRDQSAITMAIDSSKLPEAKERVKKFRRELMEFLQEGTRDRVYQLSVSLFPAERGHE